MPCKSKPDKPRADKPVHAARLQKRAAAAFRDAKTQERIQAAFRIAAKMQERIQAAFRIAAKMQQRTTR